MNRKRVLPLAVLGVAVAIAAVLMATRKPIQGGVAERPTRAVRVMVAQPQDVELVVPSQGTVLPRTEADLIAEVSGTVIWTAPTLVSGGYFHAGDSLLRLDPVDLDAAVGRAEAQLERARGEYAFANKALERRRGLASRDVASASALEEAERAQRTARASLRDAELALEQARRDRSRAEIYAPFRGRVREKSVDVGQFINRGSAVARVYATDRVEVRLPVPDAQLGYLSDELWSGAAADLADLPEVTLRARFAGRVRTWTGRIVRSEGEIDARSRMVHVVASVANPDPTRADADPSEEGMPLPVGLFVSGEIRGRRLDDVFLLPRYALTSASTLLVVDEQDRLRIRSVEVIGSQRDDVIVGDGLVAGERVCLTQLDDPIEGLRVRALPVPDPDAPPGAVVEESG